ncbi:50S ribosomal protein L29 [Cylindrospermopsis curvispora]|uniref:Large ribosomal subunit protein uL29 n=1 Tax=Cylindrospermopsis curvispora GIHE-G1 TaxID=2666332 RepID=A0A7H0F113_9CYAN|nr:50S ribosomal protein L29 [Cylindrospermopsis curvispora]QNP29729.1 50S ribosomal protein L29 [Cylindrospermopsis curvispora GIHE-G1]
MPLPKISEARELSDEKLAEEIVSLKKQLFQLRLQKATRQLEKPHQFKHARHRLAQLLTVETERKQASSQPTQESN